MTLFGRIGLAIVQPRSALSLGGDREHVGRSGADILIAIVILLVATQLRWLIRAGWLGVALDPGTGVRALVQILTRTLTVDLGFLVVAAAVIWCASGRRRELGRSFDLACVTALPLVLVELARLVVVRICAVELTVDTVAVISIAGYVWMIGLVTLAIVVVRRGEDRAPQRTWATRLAGWTFATLAGVGLALQIAWLVTNLDAIRPLLPGASAPTISLPRIGPRGELGPRVSLAPGRITVLDFWATWCNPCLASMPQLDEFTRRHPEVDVLAINLDDPAEARALFDARGYTMVLLSDDGETSERYGVSTIPHTVLIDRAGKLRQVAHGGGIDLDAAIETLLH